MEERLQKILSHAGVASRRSAEAMIQAGRVTLNGGVVTELGVKADLARDDIRVDGARVRPPQGPVYLLLNKPKGFVTTRKDPEGRRTVMELVPRVAGLFPVGRLDVATEGLLLLTNDGAFGERVAHPRYEVPRVYHAKVRGVPDHAVLARLRAGVSVRGQLLRVDRVRLLEAVNNAWLELTLHEGRQHEVRRLLEAVGYRVSKLKRVGLGPLSVRGLQPGAFRHLTEWEIRKLMQGPSGAARKPAGRARRAPHGRRPASPRRRKERS